MGNVVWTWLKTLLLGQIILNILTSRKYKTFYGAFQRDFGYLSKAEHSAGFPNTMLWNFTFLCVRRESSVLECTNGFRAGSALRSTRERGRSWGSAAVDARCCEQHAPERRSEEKGGVQEAVLNEDVVW